MAQLYGFGSILFNGADLLPQFHPKKQENLLNVRNFAHFLLKNPQRLVYRKQMDQIIQMNWLWVKKYRLLQLALQKQQRKTLQAWN